LIFLEEVESSLEKSFATFTANRPVVSLVY